MYRGPTCLNASNLLPAGDFESLAEVTYSSLPSSILNVVGQWFVTRGYGEITALPVNEQGGISDVHGMNAFRMMNGTVMQVALKTNIGKTYTFTMDSSRLYATDMARLQINIRISGFITGTQPSTLPITSFSVVVNSLSTHADDIWTVRVF